MSPSEAEIVLRVFRRYAMPPASQKDRGTCACLRIPVVAIFMLADVLERADGHAREVSAAKIDGGVSSRHVRPGSRVHGYDVQHGHTTASD